VFSDSDDAGLELVFDSKTLRIVPPTDHENSNNKPLIPGNNRPTLPRGPSTPVRFIIIYLFNLESSIYRLQQVNRQYLQVLVVLVYLVFDPLYHVLLIEEGNMR
jgi:hypothetical protein